MAMFEPHLPPEPDRDSDLRETGARIEYRPAERIARLGVRSLACPDCEMPLALPGPVGLNEEIACAFCETRAPTRAFVRGQGWPEVELRAFIG
jgi:hypothetical protein